MVTLIRKLAKWRFQVWKCIDSPGIISDQTGASIDELAEAGK
jgi:hypothetical protein